MHYTDKQYIKECLTPIKRFLMHNLSTNFNLFLKITKSVFAQQINSLENLRTYPRPPKMSDCQIIALSLTAESLGIDSESYLFGKLKADYSSDFPNLIDRSNFNRRRKGMAVHTARISKLLSGRMNESEDVYLIDSIPVPVCRIAREKTSKICRENFLTAPDKGYSAVSKSWYFGYKLHLVTSARGVVHSMDLSKASVHDIHYLKDVKQSGLSNCTLIGDKGYYSKPVQTDLFTTQHITLQAPMTRRLRNRQPFPAVFKRCRKRIETLFAQLCDQFMLKRNYAKSLAGLSVRILNKITAVTCLQYLNTQNNQPLNHLKYALAVNKS